MTKPNITVSSTDLARIENLIAATADKASPAIKMLEDELDRADIVEPSEISANVVTMNSTVRFSSSVTNEQFTYTLVYPKDMQSDGTTISILAPAGSAILGLSEGDEMLWPATEGKALKVKVEEVLYQPERAGELHR